MGTAVRQVSNGRGSQLGWRRTRATSRVGVHARCLCWADAVLMEQTFKSKFDNCVIHRKNIHMEKGERLVWGGILGSGRIATWFAVFLFYFCS